MRTPTPTPHRVSAMPNTVAGARGESDSDDGAEVSEHYGQHRDNMKQQQDDPIFK